MSRIVLVTGGTRGIGKTICFTLAKMSYKVVTTYSKNNSSYEQFIEECKYNNLCIDVYKCDISDYDTCGIIIEKIKNDIGSIEILINNAGITNDKQLKKMTKYDWDCVINTNLNGVFNVTKHVIDNMILNKYGRIINISSINALKGQFGQTNYAASKAGIHGFTMSLAQETAKYGITVNTVSPGYIQTDMIMKISEEIRKQIISQIPVGRFGTTEEIAHLISYIISDYAGFMTGANISINGGQLMF